MEIDITKHLGGMDRRLSTRMVEGAEARVLTAKRTYETSPEDLWDAMTNPERLPRWFSPVAGSLEEGGTYEIAGNASGKILKCHAPSAFDLTWEFGGHVSWVNVQIQPKDGGTELTLEHIAHVPQEMWDVYGPGAAGVGWDLAFMGLGEHLRQGDAFNAADNMEWPTTESGKQFVEGASQAWSQAAIDEGDDPEAARASAARTKAFYTGTAE